MCAAIITFRADKDVKQQATLFKITKVQEIQYMVRTDLDQQVNQV